MLRFMLKRKLVVGVMMALIFAFGLYSISKLDQELFPNVTFDQTAVMIETEQMPAENVEQFITVPVEQIISNTTHVNDYESTSANGDIQFYIDTDNGKGTEVTKEIENNLNQLKPELYGMKEVYVEQFSTSQQYEFILDISGGNLAEMSHFATEEVKPRLESLAEVSDVRLSGLEESEVHITLLTDQLAKYDISSHDILQRIEQLNHNMAHGRLAQEEGEPTIRWNTSINRISNIENLSLPSNHGVINLNEVAEVKEVTSTSTSNAWKNGDPNFIILEISRA